ncbi:MAG: MFS transporter [archaeon]|nr:MFS transporter [archaeon]
MSNNTKNETIEDKNSFYRKQQFYYVIHKIPFALLQGLFGMMYVDYFWYKLNMNQTNFIIGMVIYGIFNALNDPLMGRWSDNIDVNKWGSRRLIFIKYGGPIWALLFFLIWIPWSYDNQIIIFFHFVVMMILFDTFLTLVVIVWDALLPEIAQTIEDRNKIFFYGGIVGIIGTIPTFFAISIMETDLWLFQLFSGFIAIFCSIIFYIAPRKLKERPELQQKIESYKLKDSIKQCLGSKSFITFSMYRFFRVINGVMMGSFIFVYIILFSEDFEFILLILVGIGGILGQGLYVRYAKKYETQSLIIRGRILEIIISIIAFMISLVEGTEIIWLILFTVIIVLSGNSVFVNPYLLLVTDEDEMLYKTRREGMYLGTNAIFNKIAETIGPIIATTVLLLFDFRRELDGSAATFQPDSALIGIKFLLFIVSAIMKGLGLIFLSMYPIKGDYLKEMKEKLEIIHQEKLEAYEREKMDKST